MALAGDFKKFVNKGNMFDLAIGVVIGAAFSAVVNSLANDIILPFVSRLINFDITGAKWVLKEAVYKEDGETIKTAEIAVKYGQFIQYFITFMIVALSIFFAVKVVKAIKKSYIKNQIKYIKALKKKHPEFFDEDDEFGTLLYEKLKKNHPEYFQNELVKQIDLEATRADTPEETMIKLLKSIDEKLGAANIANENIDTDPIKEADDILEVVEEAEAEINNEVIEEDNKEE